MTLSRETAILNFVEDMRGLNIHGFVLTLNGETLAEGSWAPYELDQPHRLYSVSKSVTSLAIGLLQDDGALSLDDHIVDYFPEWVGEHTDPLLRAVTLRDMLRMATCYDRAMYSALGDSDWTKPFFYGKATHLPGTVFSYDTSASQVLCALVEKKTGRSILDFMEERLFRPLGMTGRKCWRKDGAGVSQGGTGLVMSLRDFSTLANFCMSDGRGLISEAYLKAATSCQIATDERPAPEERYGYGYQFWRMRRGFSMYGLGGQMALCLPEKKLCLCTTADLIMDSTAVQPIYDAFFRHLEDIDCLSASPEAAGRLQAQLADLRYEPLRGRENAQQRVSVALTQGALPFRTVTIERERVIFATADGEVALPYGHGSWQKGTFLNTGEACMTSGGWMSPERFRLHCELNGLSSCGMELFVVRAGDRATVRLISSLWEVVPGWSGQDWGTVLASDV